jgi:hypothetical protein
MLRRGRGFNRTAALAVLLSLCSTAARGDEVSSRNAQAKAGRQAHHLSGPAPGKPAYLWIWYSDGGPLSEEGPAACNAYTSSAYWCNFGRTTDDCKRQVQAFLDKWYADFNLVFTFTRPSADYYTVAVTGDGNWCPVSSDEGGIAYGSGCNDLPGFAGYALKCGTSAHDCATIIAHEHGHMVGLEHTDSILDVMNRTVQPNKATGFDNNENNTTDDTCDRLTQNSYQVMLSTLGAWPGGAKPSPFPSIPDAGAPDASPNLPPDDTADAAPTGGAVGNPAGGSDDGGVVTALPGFDAIARPPLPTADDSGINVPAPRSGCSLAGQPARGASPILVLLCALAAAATRFRARFPHGLRARPASEPLPCARPARRPSASRLHDRS